MGLLASLIAFFSLIPTASAFSLTPMSVEFEPTGKEATKSFLVDNNSAEKIAVQISMMTRKLAIDGKESNEDADDLFIVYPPQLLLAPNEKRTVRVTWAGDAAPKTELAYRIVAEQLPVDTEKKSRPKNAMIRMLLRYLGAVYIRPKDARPKLQVYGVKRDSKLELTFDNTGTAHQALKGLTLKVASGGKTAALAGSALKDVSGQNVLAGSKRRFSLPWPEGLPPDQGSIKVEYDVDD